MTIEVCGVSSEASAVWTSVTALANEMVVANTEVSGLTLVTPGVSVENTVVAMDVKV